MKNIIISIVLAICYILLIYGGFAFISWDCNPKNWGEGGRVLFAWFGGLIGIGVGFLGYVGLKLEKS